jgi:hypothetical protein
MRTFLLILSIAVLSFAVPDSADARCGRAQRTRVRILHRPARVTCGAAACAPAPVQRGR